MLGNLGADYKQTEAAAFATAKEYKNSVMKKFQSENRAKGDFKGNKVASDSGKYFSYPIARGPNENTGDTLLIKCVEYQSPSADPSTQMGLDSFRVKESTDDGKKITAPSVSTGGQLGVRIKNFGMTADARTRQNQKVKYYVELPIPQDINDTTSVTWGEDTMNIFQLAGLAIGRSFIESPANFVGTSVEAVRDAFTGGINIPGLNADTQNAFKAAISGKAINALGANVTPRNIISRATGQVLNSNLELLFGGVNLRSFPFLSLIHI